MRHVVSGLSLVLLISLLAAAEGDSAREFSGLISEAEIPTDLGTWQSCCSHKDCMETPVTVLSQGGEWAQVAIGEFPTFDLEVRKIYPSKNGKDYFCRRDISRPPDTRNTRCVFVGRAKQVRALPPKGSGSALSVRRDESYDADVS